MSKINYFLVLILVSAPHVANACNVNSSFYQTIDKQDWYQIQQLTKNMRTRPVSRSQIDNILSPPSNCKRSTNGRTETCSWIGEQKCRQKVKAHFSDHRLMKISKSGF